jgi:pimeloyl-ACP methyl ester carboxylesterase
MERKTCDRDDGTRCVYYTTGQGPPVLLLHGFTMSARMWTDNGTVAALKHRYRLLLPDLVGHGASGKPHDPSSYGRAYLRDIDALLAREAAPKPAVVGFSMGAELALAWAVAYPNRIRALFLMGSGWTPQEAAALYAAAERRLRDIPDRERPAAWDLDAFAALIAAVPEVIGLSADQVAAVTTPSEGLVGGDDGERPFLERLIGVLEPFTLYVMDGVPHESSWRHPDVPVRIKRFLDRALTAS